VSLAIAVAALAWATLLVVTGGFETRIAGLTLRSHNFNRPAMAGIVALALSIWAYGVPTIRSGATSLARASNQWIARRELPDVPLAMALAAGVLVFGLDRGTGVAGGSDSYGYISQAELWLHGVPVVPQPWTAQVPWPDADWTFSPLGYRPTFGGGAIVPGYAVGLPLLMAAVKLVAGHSAIFWITPVAGMVLVLIAYAVGRRLDTPLAGLLAAFLVATNATVLGELPSPMTDVLAAAALATSLYLLLGPVRRPLGAGLVAAIAVAVRPNLAATAAVMALWLCFARRADYPRRWPRQMAHALIFLTAASPGFLIPAWANWRLFGSPFVSGYGTVETIYDWSHVLPNLERYSRLLVRSWAVPALAGFVVVMIPAKRMWPRITDRSLLIGVALFVFSLVAQYLAYEPVTGEGYLRLLLPCWPFVMTGAARVALMLARPGWLAALVGVAVVLQGASGVRRACANNGCDHRSERKYPSAGQIVRSRTEPSSVIYSFQHSGSLRYYGGRMTLRYDILDPAWLDRSVDWLARRGVHSYALLDDWELERFRERFAGQERLKQLDKPIVIYHGTVGARFFDLVRPPAETAPTEHAFDRFGGPRYPGPVAPPVFGLKNGGG
jgi:hypothetical protein